MAAVTQNFDNLEFRFTTTEEFLDDKFCERAKELHDGGMSWNEIAEEMDSDYSTVSLAAHIAEAGRLSFRTEKELARRVQQARDSGEAWAKIGARAGGLTESRVQWLYEQATEQAYFASYIGKGGRPRNDGLGFRGKDSGEPIIEVGEGKPVRGRGRRKPAVKLQLDLDGDLSVEEVQEAIEGKTIEVARPGGKTATLKVGEVVTVAQNKRGDWGAKIKTTDGKERTFALKKVQSVR